VDEVPLGVVTVMSTVPAVPAGAVARMALSDRTVKSRAALPPNSTPLAPVKPVPRIVTCVPPLTLPELPAMPVTLGAAAAV
jgi:hypothetical protein